MPPPHEPFTHMVMPHEAPLAAHRPPTQQPPLGQLLSSQQAAPAVPHAAQVPGIPMLHTLPGVVQKLGLGLGVTQQGWPAAPQRVKAPAQTPALHVPHEPLMQLFPQEAPAAAQVLLAMQQPPIAQVSFSQQGCPVPPQLWQAPPTHEVLFPQARPA